jgi:hypothetical protein
VIPTQALHKPSPCDRPRKIAGATIAGVVIATGGAASYAGEITDEELERERGRGGLRYSFDIKNGVERGRR